MFLAQIQLWVPSDSDLGPLYVLRGLLTQYTVKDASPPENIKLIGAFN